LLGAAPLDVGHALPEIKTYSLAWQLSAAVLS